MKRLSILGSTGSVGMNVLRVVNQFPERFSVAAISGGRNVGLLAEQVMDFGPEVAVVLDEDLARQLKEMLKGEGNVEIFVVDANGGTAQNLTNESQADDHGPVWSPDGQQLVFYSNREGNWDVFSIQIDSSGVTNLTNTPTRDEQTPAWRP